MGIDIEELSCDTEIINFLDKLSLKNPSVLGYHYPFFRDMLILIGIGEPVYLGARQLGKLVGLLPAFTFNTKAGAVYSSLPFFGPNAGILCDTSKSQAEIHQALLKALLFKAEASNALCCSIYTPFLFKDFQLYDSVMPNAIIVNKFTQYLNLTSTMNSWQTGALGRNLRKAYREGIEIDTKVNWQRLNTFYDIYQQNCIEYGIPQKPKLCIDFLTQPNIIGNHTSIYFAFHQGKMIAGLLTIYSSQTLSYYIPCTISSARSLQPGVMLIYQAIKDAQARGIRYWNWESSPSREDGVYLFKEKWGSIEGSYRIYLKTFRPSNIFRDLGQNNIAKHFPYYFVYPFDLLFSTAN
jgi:Acetyltransferase (GNAT) domain